MSDRFAVTEDFSAGWRIGNNWARVVGAADSKSWHRTKEGRPPEFEGRSDNWYWGFDEGMYCGASEMITEQAKRNN